MPTYIGFNTIGQYKKFTKTDFELIKRDLLNAFNIRYGEKVGRPGYGTKIWTFMFEPQIPDTQAAIKQEIQRVVDQDPRVYAVSVETVPQDTGLLVDLAVQLAATGSVDSLRIFFDEQTARASYV